MTLSSTQGRTVVLDDTFPGRCWFGAGPPVTARRAGDCEPAGDGRSRSSAPVIPPEQRGAGARRRGRHGHDRRRALEAPDARAAAERQDGAGGDAPWNHAQATPRRRVGVSAEAREGRLRYVRLRDDIEQAIQIILRPPWRASDVARVRRRSARVRVRTEQRPRRAARIEVSVRRRSWTGSRASTSSASR